jgi:putrescine aminotransferase
MEPKRPALTFEDAMRLSRGESAALYGRHVDPPLGLLLKLGDVDRRYSRAEGVHLFDDTGRACLDLTGGYGALNLGHNPAEVLAAVRAAQCLPAVLLVGYHPLVGALAEALAAILPGELSLSIFGSGGAEAVEHALRTARACTGRKKFVSCVGAYHGLSFGALSVGGSPRYREELGPLLEHCALIPFDDLEALERSLHRKDVAAFIVEPIQGEGGAVVPADGYLKGAERLCRKHGTLLILDEIQTGFGRTGALFAMEHEGVVPDIVTLSKSLGSGVVPVSVSVSTEEVWKRAFGSRGRFDLTISTFAGNPAACAAALKTIEIIRRDGIPERARALGDYARGRLEALRARHRTIKGIRGRGLMLGIEIETSGLIGGLLESEWSTVIASELLNRHDVLTSYYDLDPRVLRFEPPLVITREQIDTAVDALDKVFSRSRAALLASSGLTAARAVVGRRKG